jgi:hypothetical protein
MTPEVDIDNMAGIFLLIFIQYSEKNRPNIAMAICRQHLERLP